MGPGDDASTPEPADGGDDLPLPISRQTLLRIVIVIAIGIPIVLEGLTFVGLVGNQLADGDGGPADGATPTDGPSFRSVAIGDDLLAETDQPERLETAAVSTTDGWRFTLAVTVTNTGADGYVFRITQVRTDSGVTFDRDETTGQLASGESTVLTGAWDVPDGEVPDRVTVEATVPTDEGARTVTETVAFATVDVSG
ncbi:MAG: hypothetical protein V5A24_06035 [Haloarculaceae archaeon]